MALAPEEQRSWRCGAGFITVRAPTVRCADAPGASSCVKQVLGRNIVKLCCHAGAGLLLAGEASCRSAGAANGAAQLHGYQQSAHRRCISRMQQRDRLGSPAAGRLLLVRSRHIVAVPACSRPATIASVSRRPRADAADKAAPVAAGPCPPPWPLPHHGREPNRASTPIVTPHARELSQRAK